MPDKTSLFESSQALFASMADYLGASKVEKELNLKTYPTYESFKNKNKKLIDIAVKRVETPGVTLKDMDIRQEDMLRARSEELSGQLSAYSQELSTTNRKLASTISALEQSQQDLQEIEARTRLTTEMMPAHIAHVTRSAIYLFQQTPKPCDAGTPRRHHKSTHRRSLGRANIFNDRILSEFCIGWEIIGF